MRYVALFFLVVAAISGLIGPLFVSNEEYEKIIRMEVDSSRGWYGDDAAIPIVERTDRQYLMVKEFTKIDVAIQHLNRLKGKVDQVTRKQPEPWEVDVPPEPAEAIANPNIIVYSVWLLCWRFNNTAMWLGYVLPLMFALAFDGVMRRNARMASVEYASPSWHSAIWVSNIVGIGVIAAIAVSPVALPIAFYPSAFVVIGLLGHQLLAAIQPSA